MFGLRVSVPGAQPCWVALDQDRYVVSAGVHWHRHAPKVSAQLYFQASGIDDHDDDLTWLRVGSPSVRSKIDITVVNTNTGTPPRRKRRRAWNWDVFFERQVTRDLKRIAVLESRLQKVKDGHSEILREWPIAPCQVAFRVLLNRAQLGTIGVADPGTLSATVYLKKRSGKATAALSVHGGDRLGPELWRWYKWPQLDVHLKLDDEVRIQIVSPARLAANHLRRGQNDQHPALNELVQELEELRRAVKLRYRSDVAAMKKMQRERLAPRRYPRL